MSTDLLLRAADKLEAENNPRRLTADPRWLPVAAWLRLASTYKTPRHANVEMAVAVARAILGSDQ